MLLCLPLGGCVGTPNKLPCFSVYVLEVGFLEVVFEGNRQKFFYLHPLEIAFFERSYF